VEVSQNEMVHTDRVNTGDDRWDDVTMYHDFKHSKASRMSIPSLFRISIRQTEHSTRKYLSWPELTIIYLPPSCSGLRVVLALACNWKLRCRYRGGLRLIGLPEFRHHSPGPWQPIWLPIALNKLGFKIMAAR
jgi:hypothetical protein